MTELNSKDQYIKCSRCKCKYINDDEHIKNDFGYNRLEERYKTCMTCRDRMTTKTTCDKCLKSTIAIHLKRHQKTNICKQWELLISRIDINDPDIEDFHYTWNNEPIPIYKDKKRTIEYKQQYLGFDPNAKQLSVEEQIKLLLD